MQPTAVSAPTAPTQETDQWIGKEEAAERLNRSVRTVLEMAATGAIKSKKEMNDASRKMVIKLHAGDIERILYERDHPQPTATRAIAPSAPIAALPPGPEEAAASAAPSAPIAAPTAPWDWLTLDECAATTRLPASALLSLILGGRLPAEDIGVRPGGRWRVCRADLEAFRGAASVRN